MPSLDEGDPTTKERGRPAPRRAASLSLRLVTVWAAAASMLAVAMAAGELLPSPFVAERIVPSVSWGWAGLRALPQQLSRASYLDLLACAAEEWYRVEPDDASTTARRLNELRQGYSVLLLAEHRPLTPGDRAWLVESCRSWAARCDGYLIALETGSEPHIIRRQVDRLIEEVAAAIRKQVKVLPDRGPPADHPPSS